MESLVKQSAYWQKRGCNDTALVCHLNYFTDTESSEMVDKAKAYLEHSVQLCWLLLPGLRSIYVFSSFDDLKTFTHTDAMLDDTLKISIPLADVFAYSIIR